MKVYIYPEHSMSLDGSDPRDKLNGDKHCSDLALFEGRIKDGNVEEVYLYEVSAQNFEQFEELARSHGCTEIFS